MIILSIETSCDETAVSVLNITGKPETPNIQVLSDALISQANLHSAYGGVFPTLARREHRKNLPVLLEIALKKAKLHKKTSQILTGPTKETLEKILSKEPELFESISLVAETVAVPKIDAIAVTSGPGLEPALWVGINAAQALGFLWSIPVVPVNHMEGHFLSVLIAKTEQKITYPALALLISGGHTELVLSRKPFSYEILGKTRDDAVGEAYDKVARLLSLPYPGGPAVAKLAEKARKNHKKNRGLSGEAIWTFPRPMLHSKDLDFSFSGLKTSVLYATKGKILTEIDKQNIAGEFEEAITEVLVSKTNSALSTHKIKTLIVAGGVSGNTYIKSKLRSLAKKHATSPLFPTKKLSTDNSIMIAIASYSSLKTKIPEKIPIKANGNLSL